MVTLARKAKGWRMCLCSNRTVPPPFNLSEVSHTENVLDWPSPLMGLGVLLLLYP